MTHPVFRELKGAEFIYGKLYVRCQKCKRLFIRHNACTDACDMEEGPCACGAWHHEDHVCTECPR